MCFGATSRRNHRAHRRTPAMQDAVPHSQRQSAALQGCMWAVSTPASSARCSGARATRSCRRRGARPLPARRLLSAAPPPAWPRCRRPGCARPAPAASALPALRLGEQVTRCLARCLMRVLLFDQRCNCNIQFLNLSFSIVCKYAMRARQRCVPTWGE